MFALRCWVLDDAARLLQSKIVLAPRWALIPSVMPHALRGGNILSLRRRWIFADASGG
jgi:hypothetical protein